jgi:hypothetical protein
VYRCLAYKQVVPLGLVIFLVYKQVVPLGLVIILAYSSQTGRPSGTRNFFNVQTGRPSGTRNYFSVQTGRPSGTRNYLNQFLIPLNKLASLLFNPNPAARITASSPKRRRSLSIAEYSCNSSTVSLNRLNW